MSVKKVTLNGTRVTGQESNTILELAHDNGVDIPTLCYLKGLPPTGACRVCIVEIDGSRTLVGACHTPIFDGMIIHTHSPKVLETRKTIVELLMASHCGTCFMCNKANSCELRKVAAELEVGVSPYQVRKRYYQIEDLSPYIHRNLTKCILCRKCIRACAEIAKYNLFSTGYRGFETKIVVDLDQSLDKEVCQDCGICILHCPTGALTKPRRFGEAKTGKPLVISSIHH